MTCNVSYESWNNICEVCSNKVSINDQPYMIRENYSNEFESDTTRYKIKLFCSKLCYEKYLNK